MILSFLSGVFGGIIPKAMDLWDASSKRAHEVKLIELETERQLKVGAAEMERDVAVADAESFKASMSMDTGLEGASQWVKNINAFVRPAITFYLVICASVIVIANYDPSMYAMAVSSLLDLTTMAVGFWFGNRSVNKK